MKSVKTIIGKANGLHEILQLTMEKLYNTDFRKEN